jgi:hypothetical protein
MMRLLILVRGGVALGALAVWAVSPSTGHAGDQPGTDLAAVTLTIHDVGTLAMPAGVFQAEPTGTFRHAAVKADFVREDVGSLGNAAAANSGRTTTAEVGALACPLERAKTDAGSCASNEVATTLDCKDRTAQRRTDLHFSMPAPPATIPTSELSLRAHQADVDGVVLPSALPAESASSNLSPQPASGNAEPAEAAEVRYSLVQPIPGEADPSAVVPSRSAVSCNAESEATPSTRAKVPVPSEPGKLSSGKQVPAIPSAAAVPGPIPAVAARPVSSAIVPGGPGPYPQCRYLGCSGPLAWRGCVYCNEIQHYDYYPAMHGYYYFAPYNAIQVPFQQAFVARFGGDPRAPYADGVFQRVYAAYWAAHPVPASRLPATTQPEKVLAPEPANP